MTREELKAHCEKQIEMCEMWAISKGEKPSGKIYEEHKLILELLEQQPCDDAISREAVIEILENYGCTNREGLIFKDIQALPPVTQKPKYWIDKDNKIYKMPDDIPTMTIQYPTITHEDTISRTEVMNVISDFVTFEKYIDKHNHITFEPLEQMINSLPSVTQKSGKWIRIDKDKCKCDQCEVISYIAMYPNGDANYCPNCGCRMVEPQESEKV